MIRLPTFIKSTSDLAALPATIALVILTYLFGYPLLALNLFLGFVLGYVVYIPIRYLYFQERPRPKEYKNWWQKLDSSSFPSMHAYRVGLIMMLLGEMFGYGLFVLFALIICWTRIHLQKHHVRDVVVGLLLGIAASFIF